MRVVIRGNGVGARNLEGVLEGSSMLLGEGALDKGEALAAISIEGLLVPVLKGEVTRVRAIQSLAPTLCHHTLFT